MRTRLPAATSALVLAACGGGDDGGAPTRASFVRDANAVCREYSQRSSEVPAVRSVGDVGRWAGDIRKVIAAGLQEQRRVRAPDDLRADYQRYLALAGRQLAVLADIEAAGRRQDVEAYDRLFPRGDRLDEQSDAIARRLGLTACIGG